MSEGKSSPTAESAGEIRLVLAVGSVWEDIIGVGAAVETRLLGLWTFCV